MRLKMFFRRRSIQSVFRFLADFFENSSIHGLSHLARTNRHWLEFSFWLLTIVFMTAGAIHLSVDLIAQYKRENVVVTIDDNYMVWNTTRPSFTLCPKDMLDLWKTKRYLREQKLKTELSIEDVLDFLKQLSRMTISTIKPLKDLNYGISPNDYMGLILNLSSYDIIEQKNMNLIRTVSDVGICYTHHNVLINDATSSVHWGDRSQHATSMQNKTSGPFNYNYYDNFQELNYLLYAASYVNTYIHSPYEMPTTWSRTVSGSDPNKMLLVSMRVTEVTYGSNLISGATVEQRQCRTHEESNLLMFPKTYSQHLCLMECRAQFALRHCHCLPHFYDRLEFRKSQQMKICDVKGLNCLAKYNKELRNLQSSQEGPSKCACLPNCNLLGVSTSIVGERLNFGTFSSMKVFNAHFEELPKFQYRRSIIFNTLDFAVAIGNVLGVFLGFCLLSLIEIVYFFTLRLFWFAKGYRGAVVRTANN